MIDPSVFIHEKAHVEGSDIGALTRVWQFASVIRGSKVGERCSVAANAIVDGATVGDDSIISHGAFIDPGILIGKNVFIGPHVSLCNDFWPKVEKDGWFNLEDLIEGRITVTDIEDGASIGANAVIMPGLTIGSGAMIAAGAVVTCDVPAGHLCARDGSMTAIDPARIPNRMRQAA